MKKTKKLYFPNTMCIVLCILFVFLTSCASTKESDKNIKITIDEFLTRYCSLPLNESYNYLLSIKKAEARKEYIPETKQNKYIFTVISGYIDIEGNEGMYMNVYTDKKDFVDSVEINCGELGIMTICNGNPDNLSMLAAYYAYVLSCFDMTLDYCIESIQNLMSEQGETRKFYINDSILLRMNFYKNWHSFHIYANSQQSN